LSMHGLHSARGFIQSRIADALELRYTPVLHFVLDPGVKLSVEASSIIREALNHGASQPSGAEAQPAESAEGGAEDEARDDDLADEDESLA